MMRSLSIACAFLALAACSSSSPSVSDRYQGVEPVSVSSRESYRVYDKPEQSVMLVTRRPGTGYMPGSIPTPVNPDTRFLPRPIFKEAADRYLAQAGRSDCQITDGYPVTRMAYEFQYACGAERASN